MTMEFPTEQTEAALAADMGIEPAQKIVIPAAPAPGETPFEAVRRALNADDRLVITDIARKHGLDDSDPLWSIIAALQLHLNYVLPIPQQIETAAAAAAALFQLRINQTVELIDEIPRKTAEADALLTAAAEMRAMKAVDGALRHFSEESEKIIIKVSTDAVTAELNSKIDEIKKHTETTVNQLTGGLSNKLSEFTKKAEGDVLKLTAGLDEKIQKIVKTSTEAKTASAKAYWTKMGFFAAAVLLLAGVGLGGGGYWFFNQNSKPYAVTLTPALQSLARCWQAENGFICDTKKK